MLRYNYPRKNKLLYINTQMSQGDINTKMIKRVGFKNLSQHPLDMHIS